MNYPTYDIEEQLLEMGYKYIVGVDEAGRGCENPDCQVLTNNGWKFYEDITLDDLVLSYTDKDTIEWQPIEEVIDKDFKGNLIDLSNRSIHISVTPDHCFDVLRRVFYRDKGDGNKLKLKGFTFRGRKGVLDLRDSDYIPRGGVWNGKEQEFFILPAIDKIKFDHSGRDYSEKKIPMDLWLAFIGIYLAEGSVNHTADTRSGYRISISQIKKDSRKKIYELCCKLPFEAYKEKSGIVIRNKQLWTYMKQFGYCYDKHIPEELKDLSPRQLNILIDWMILGNGACYQGENRKEVCVYYTTSERLRDDFEEILLKAGWTYKTTVREPRDACIHGRKIRKENCVPCFEIRLRRNNKAHAKHFYKEEKPYEGKVFCLRLPEHHNFYVRRDGSGYFTGNSLAGPVTAGAVCIPVDIVPELLGKVNDSKKMSAKRREKMFDFINETCLVGCHSIDAEVIDDINILEATKIAMRIAVEKTEYYDFVLVDGTVDLSQHLVNVPLQKIIKGDARSVSIAAGSVIAKVTRDRYMIELHKEFPIYNYLKNKGYGTQEHIQAIQTYGITEHHRMTFRKVGR